MSEREQGKWEDFGLSGVVGVHAALMHTEQVLFFCRPEEPVSHRFAYDSDMPNPNGLIDDVKFKPTDPDQTLSTIFPLQGVNAGKPIISPVEENPFCAGHVHLADGRLLVAGGDKRANTGCNTNFDFKFAPVGTQFGLRSLRVFTPTVSDAGHWKTIGEISDCRWYPTCSVLPDGRVFIISGSIDDQDSQPNLNPTCELLPPLPGGPQFLPFLIEAWPYHSYPFVSVLPSGELFVFVRCTGYYLTLSRDKAGQECFAVAQGPSLNGKSPSDAHEPAKHYPNNGAAVLLPLRPSDNPKESYTSEVLVLGGAGRNIYDHWVNDNTLRGHDVAALADTWRLKTKPTDPTTEWERGTSMPHARVMPDAVLLPDGTVLVVNGASRGYAGGTAATGPAISYNAVKGADLYDPDTDSWKELASAAYERLYHSTALLLPDARVLVAGNDHRVTVDREPGDGAEHSNTTVDERFVKPLYKIGKLTEQETAPYRARAFEYRVEVFSPPYLCTGKNRPIIEQAPERVSFESKFAIEVTLKDVAEPEAGKIKCVLLKPGAVTHNNNMTQRHVELRVLGIEKSQLTLQAPPNEMVAPPGYYMLFVLYEGIPSVARFIQLPLRPGGAAQDSRVSSRGMELWLRADTGVLTDSNSDVHSWSDLSGSGNNVMWNEVPVGDRSRSPPKLLPQGLGGQACIRLTLVSSSRRVDYQAGEVFDTSDDESSPNLDMRGGFFRSIRTDFLPAAGSYSVFVVLHVWPGGPNGVGGLIGWGDFRRQAEGACVALKFGPPSLMDRHLPLAPGLASIHTHWGPTSAHATMTRPILLETSFDGSQSIIRINGELSCNRSVSGHVRGPGPLLIGATAFGDGVDDHHYFRGDIAEVIVYGGALDDKERAGLEEYFNERYGLD